LEEVDGWAEVGLEAIDRARVEIAGIGRQEDQVAAHMADLLCGPVAIGVAQPSEAKLVSVVGHE